MHIEGESWSTTSPSTSIALDSFTIVLLLTKTILLDSPLCDLSSKGWNEDSLSDWAFFLDGTHFLVFLCFRSESKIPTLWKWDCTFFLFDDDRVFLCPFSFSLFPFFSGLSYSLVFGNHLLIVALLRMGLHRHRSTYIVCITSY